MFTSKSINLILAVMLFMGIFSNAQTIPTSTITCPTFANGDVTLTIDGIERKILVTMDEAKKETPGPLIFWWHGMGSDPKWGSGYFGNFDNVKADGGIVIAPYGHNTVNNFPWYCGPTCTTDWERDFRLADEIVGCLSSSGSAIKINTNRIHVAGMSAGGLMSSQMAFVRSNYVASVVIFSGGFYTSTTGFAYKAQPKSIENPNNKFPSLVYHGGPSDIVGMNFQDSSEWYRDLANGKDQAVILCNHGQGHVGVPQPYKSNVYDFLKAHPYGITPEPYSCGLPEDFPNYCGITGAGTCTDPQTTAAPTKATTSAPTKATTMAPSTMAPSIMAPSIMAPSIMAPTTMESPTSATSPTTPKMVSSPTTTDMTSSLTESVDPFDSNGSKNVKSYLCLSISVLMIIIFLIA